MKKVFLIIAYLFVLMNLIFIPTTNLLAGDPKQIIPIRTIASKADKNVLKAFEDLNFIVVYNPNLDATGYFKSSKRAIEIDNKSDLCIYHELGHFVSFIAGNVDTSSEFKKIFDSEKSKFKASRGNTDYILSSSKEYFADSYQDYIEKPAALKRERPKTYDYILKTVKTIDDTRVENISKLYTKIYELPDTNIMTINYYGNGATGLGSSTKNTNKNLATLHSNIKYGRRDIETVDLYNVGTLFKKTGYHVNSSTAWKVGSASSTKYLSQKSANLIPYVSQFKKSLNLYANWIPNTITINYYGNGATGLGSSNKNTNKVKATVTTTKKYNEDITALNLWNVGSLFSKKGYHVNANSAWKVGSSTSTKTISQKSTNLRLLFEDKANTTINLYANWVKD